VRFVPGSAVNRSAFVLKREKTVVYDERSEFTNINEVWLSLIQYKYIGINYAFDLWQAS